MPKAKQEPKVFQDLSVDLETLGRRAGCVVLSIGAVFFDRHTGAMGDEMYCVVNTASCVEHGLHVDHETEKWWSEQSEAARAVVGQAAITKISPRAKKRPNYPLPVALQQLTDFVRRYHDPRRVKVWGCGPSFDNAILANCYAAIGQPLPWEFWNDRDVRTMRDIAPHVKIQRTGTYHNALDDAKDQAVQLCEIFKFIEGLGTAQTPKRRGI